MESFQAPKKLVWTPFERYDDTNRVIVSADVVLGEDGSFNYRPASGYAGNFERLYYNWTSVRVTVDLLQCAVIDRLSTVITLPTVLVHLIGSYGI